MKNIFIICLLCISSTVFCQNDTLITRKVSVPYEEKPAEFLELYKDVVYGTNVDEDSKSYMRLWAEPINIYFDTTVPYMHQNEFMAFVTKISESIDSLQINKVKTKEDSNYLIYYRNSPQDIDYVPKINNKHSGYYIWWNEDNRIYDGTTMINTMNLRTDTLQLLHLKHQFVLSLGYFKTTDKLLCTDYFSKCTSFKKFSERDQEILAYHYSYGICKGVDKEAFEELHRTMLKYLSMYPNSKGTVTHEYKN